MRQPDISLCACVFVCVQFGRHQMRGRVGGGHAPHTLSHRHPYPTREHEWSFSCSQLYQNKSKRRRGGGGCEMKSQAKSNTVGSSVLPIPMSAPGKYSVNESTFWGATLPILACEGRQRRAGKVTRERRHARKSGGLVRDKSLSAPVQTAVTLSHFLWTTRAGITAVCVARGIKPQESFQKMHKTFLVSHKGMMVNQILQHSLRLVLKFQPATHQLQLSGASPLHHMWLSLTFFH